MTDPFHWRFGFVQLIIKSHMHPSFLGLIVLGGCLGLTGCGSQSDTIKPVQQESAPTDPSKYPSMGSNDSEPDQHDQQAKETKAQEPAQPSRDQEIAAADKALQQGDLQTAASALQRVLVADPEDVEILFRLATIQAQTGNLAAAVGLLDSIPEDHPQAGLPSLGQSADWCLQLGRFVEAEERYTKVIQRAPTAVVARRQLAYLLNRQGRRHEASEHVRYLCKLGDVRQDELHSLMVVNNAVFDDPNEPHADKSNARLYFPIGSGAVARKYFTDGNFDEAEAALRELVESGQAHPSHLALYGRVVTESQDDERFLWWLSRTNETTKQYSEYWAAVGTYLLNARRFEEAVRALAQAIDLDPTDAPSMRRINQALLALDKQTEADKWHQRFADMRAITLASNRVGEGDTPDLDSVKTVYEGLEKLDRPLESTMWKLVEAFYRKSPADVIKKLNEQRKSLVRARKGYPTKSSRLCSLDIDSYPLPTIDVPDSAMAVIKLQTNDAVQVDPPAFRNVATEIGIDHTYQIASKQQDFGFAIYQQLGGGVAVLDYDRDGKHDLYFAQGASDAPQLVSDKTNQLYRGTDDGVTAVTDQSETTETHYSVGVTAGDWNQDGWVDLVVANIGHKKLLINNGDGTFSTTMMTQPNATDLTSSIAMGDVTGDSLPDIFALHYVEDEGMFDRPEVADDGEVLTKSPASFKPGIDRVFVNDGSGGMKERNVGDPSKYASTGLGVIISDLDGQPGNEVFVGNDIRANHLWKQDPELDQLNDIGSLSGCALGYGGLITASMGVAAADFDQSGTLDIHVTNFLLEPVSLFMNRGGNFQDRCVPMKLARDSTAVLGFGSQPIDYNNDGRSDIAVTNGHIERPARDDEPFHQQPQLFTNLGDRFELAEVADSSDYWQGKYLGRALATLDFNQDGKLDLLFTHINQPSALLINETPSKNHWLQIELVGTDSERDAIGAHVEVTAGEKTWHDWANAGDGYLARNEPALHFGLGSVAKIDSLTVTWPTGKQQVIENIDADQRILIVENDELMFVRAAK